MNLLLQNVVRVRGFSCARFVYSSLFSASTCPFSSTAATTATLNPKAQAALRDIGVSAKKSFKQMTKKELKNFPGNIMNFKLSGHKPEFHNIDRNRHDHIYEPSDKFKAVITTSKNNVWIVVQNKSRNYRNVFKSYCGNVGIRKKDQQSPSAAHRVGQNIARKLKRLGVNHVDVQFRRVSRVPQVLDAFQTCGLIVTSLIHRPRICKGPIPKPRKRRKV